MSGACAAYDGVVAGRQKKDPINNKGTPTRTIRRGGSKGPGDMTSQMLKKAGLDVGNDGLKGLLKNANGKRDGVVEFIMGRLAQVRKVQMKEGQALQQHGDWYRYAFRSQAGYNLPDPSRWHLTAGLYKKAAEAACNGDLGRAVQYLEQGMAKEAEAWDTVPVFVQEKLAPEDGCWSERPESADNVSEEAQCDQRDTPQELIMADRILAMDPVVKPVTAQLQPRPHDWFLGEEEEEEAGADSKKK